MLVAGAASWASCGDRDTSTPGESEGEDVRAGDGGQVRGSHRVWKVPWEGTVPRVRRELGPAWEVPGGLWEREAGKGERAMVRGKAT